MFSLCVVSESLCTHCAATTSKRAVSSLIDRLIVPSEERKKARNSVAFAATVEAKPGSAAKAKPKEGAMAPLLAYAVQFAKVWKRVWAVWVIANV